MEPKTKKILIGSGVALLVTIGLIIGYKQYKKHIQATTIDVAALTPDQRKKLQDRGIAIPTTGTVKINPSEVVAGQGKSK